MADDHYGVLGVDPDADAETITAAYQDLLEELKERQPDDVERRFERAKRAHEVLTDEDRRAAYDRRRQRGGTEEPSRHTDSSQGIDLGGQEIRIAGAVIALLLLVVAAEGYLVWSQSQRVAALEDEVAADDDRIASLQQNLTDTRDALDETRSQLEEARRINREYEVVVDELSNRTEDYIYLYDQCDRARSCSVLGVEEPIVSGD